MLAVHCEFVLYQRPKISVVGMLREVSGGCDSYHSIVVPVLAQTVTKVSRNHLMNTAWCMEEAESQALLYIDSYRNSKRGGGPVSHVGYVHSCSVILLRPTALLLNQAIQLWNWKRLALKYEYCAHILKLCRFNICMFYNKTMYWLKFSHYYY